MVVEEAMTVFGSVANSRWFASTTCILFLNKIDLFREKLGTYPPSRRYEVLTVLFLRQESNSSQYLPLFSLPTY
jgi:hypothetical protein